MISHPFWYGYGGKWRDARRYPAPIHSTIIEPFAGAAGYSLRYPSHHVILVERDPQLAAVWRYLLRVSPAELLALPDLAEGQRVDDLPVCPEARLLIGLWCNRNGWTGNHEPSKWMRQYPEKFWGARVRGWLAAQVIDIRHWQLVEGDYHEAPAIEVTWFVDPPYSGRAGENYRHGSGAIDYAELGAWCLSRRGQIIACEAAGADWLPFEAMATPRATTRRAGEGRTSAEGIWYRTDSGEPRAEGKQYLLLGES